MVSASFFCPFVLRFILSYTYGCFASVVSPSRACSATWRPEGGVRSSWNGSRSPRKCRGWSLRELVLVIMEPSEVSPPQSNRRIRFTCYNWDPRPCPAPYLRAGCLSEVRLTIPHCPLARWPCLPYHACAARCLRGLSHLASFFCRLCFLCGLLTQLFVPGSVCFHMLSTHAGPGSDSLPEEGSGRSWEPAPGAVF